MSFLVLAPIIFLAFVVEATAGFGSVMISLAVGTLFWPVSELLPIVVAISLCLSCYMVSRHWRSVEFKLIGKKILPLMGTGVGVGFVLAPYVSARSLRALLGVIVVGAAARGLKGMLAPRSVERTPNSIVSGGWIAGAGVVHGLLATGGPPLVYALEGMGLAKHNLRSTLASVWFLFNIVLVTRFTISGAFAGPQLHQVVTLLPVVVLAIAVGEFCHARVSERNFRVAIFSLLIVAGGLLLLPLLLNWVQE